MSERDTSGLSERDTSAADSASPYDEPTGRIPVPDPERRAAVPPPPPPRTPEGAPADRDDFYRRHARTPAPYSRVDDLDDLDPGDVETRRVPGALPPTPVPADDTEPTVEMSRQTPVRPPAPRPAPGPVRSSRFESAQPQPAADDAVTTPEPALPPVTDAAQPSTGTARHDFFDEPGGADDDPESSGRSTAVLDTRHGATPAPVAHDDDLLDDEDAVGSRARRKRLFGRRRDDEDTMVPGATTPSEAELDEAEARARRGTLDLGLLLLRVALGMVVGAHGLQKLFGLWNGPRLSGFEGMLIDAGFDSGYAQVLSIVGALTETIGGLLVILGLLTPVGASAILGTMLVAAAYRVTTAGGLEFFASAQGIEFELFLAAAAAAVILTGPGLYSLDYPRGWARRPFIGSVVWLIVGVAAAVAVWVVANGTNPLN